MSVLETTKVWEGARIAGASEIRALDLNPRKQEWATRFGATHTEPGPVDLAGMVTNVAPLAGWEEALGAMREGDVIRTVVTP